MIVSRAVSARRSFAQIKSPAESGANDSFYYKEVTVYSVTRYRHYYCYWIWIFLFLFLLFFWRLNPVCINFPVTNSSYTSLGQAIKSKSYANTGKAV